jgi:hypothetical protein
VTNELKKKLDQTTTDQKDSQQKYTDLQTKSAKEKDEIKFELDSKINKKGMTLDKKELTATTRQFSTQSKILGCNPVETQNLKNQKFLSKDHLLL